MTPRWCSSHHHWTDGACVAGRRSLTRHDLTQRLATIDGLLGDEEERQSRGFYAIKELEAERASLLVMAEAIR